MLMGGLWIFMGCEWDVKMGCVSKFTHFNNQDSWWFFSHPTRDDEAQPPSSGSSCYIEFLHLICIAIADFHVDL